MDNNIIEFTNFLLNHNFSSDLVEKFKIYQSTLTERNKKINLISKNSLDRIWSAHFLDSILICEEIDFSNKTVLDFGSGAGFPGIPIKILYPTMKICLIESVRKKALFLRYLLEKLELQNSEVLNIRFEDLGNQFINFFDIILVRAVRMDKIYYEKCAQLLKQKGAVILYKGKSCETELEKIECAMFFKNVRKFQKRDSALGTRNFIVIGKNG
ncbi:MAG: 16S rRNA (guanine(527)-N(7))-methyltransferase RsmG [Candidatus Cloacimonetes bacterium]|nr:16S rRNA (guanine(527)-N(7))-methyltransferase RsmG [Candidatus Cloacimonadota bacterium]